MSRQTQETELLVIGSGPGGYVAAIRAAQLGIDTTLVDRDAIGGTCLNYGCIPSKALLTSTERIEAVRNGESMGIDAAVSVDFEQMGIWKGEVVDGLTDGVSSLCRKNGITIQQGHAELLDETTARVVGPDEEEVISFENVIIATGSRPIKVPGFEFDSEHILDSRNALSVPEIPDSLVVIGAGYIGMELSTVFARLGTDITVIEMLDRALPEYEENLSRPVIQNLRSLGVTFEFGEMALDWQSRDNQVTVFTETEDETIYEYQADKVLVAVGRTPVTDGLGLDAVGLSTDDQGVIETDEHGQTETETVFAVGDVAGEPMLAHKASHEGLIAAETIAGETTPEPNQAVPAVVFTHPEIGTIGKTESEAVDAGYDPVVGEFPFKANGRALTRDSSIGFVRIIGDSETGNILGCQVVGKEVSELLGEVGVAMNGGLSLADIAGTIHTHPTLSEAVMEAAANALDEAIHV